MQKKKMLKRGLCLALTFVMSVTGLPSANLLAKAQSGRDAGEGEGQEIQFEPGETRFYENLTIQDVTSSNPSVLSVTAKDEVSKALYDRTAESADNSLSCFDLETPNAQMDLSSAEFRIESAEGGYTIYNQAEGKYIVNGRAETALFSQSSGVCSLEKVEENGAVSFKIARVSTAANDNHGRAMYFDSARMDFMLWGPPVAEASNRDFKLELLEKQDAPSAGDPIPGYRRASEITSGKNYLVTEFYHDSASNEDVIIILYAKDNLARTKLYREDRTVGVMVEAVGSAGQTADLTVQGSVSKVTIVQCKHVFGEWEMTVEPTADADGQRKRVCSRCNQEEIEIIERNAYISGSLADKIQEAQACSASAYTAESYAKLQEALRNAQQLASNASNADKLAAISAIRQALERLERVADDIVAGIKPTVRDSAKKNYFKYTGGWNVSDSEAYIDLGASDPNAEQNYYELYFEGNKVNIFAVKQPNHGKVRFSVDGGEETTVDLYNAENIGAVSVYEISGLSEGPHVLKAVTLNEKSGGKVVNQIAYAEVTHLPYSGGTPNLGGAIVDTDTQWTQDRFGEVAASTKKTAELSAWKNDKAISEIALISKDCSLDNVTVTAAALTSGQNTIGAEHVKTTFIKSTKAYNGGYLGYGDPNREIPPATTGNRSESSDILYQEGGSMNMQYESVLPVWVEFEIPEDAAAGTYTGALTATADGIDTPLTFTYTVNVQDVTLPDAGTYKDTFDIELWQYPYSSAEYYNVEPFSEEHLNIMRSSMQIYKELGGHAITASIVEEAWAGQTYSKNDVHYPSMVKWTKSGDGFQYDWTDFDKWVSFCIEMGLGDKIVLYSIAPWHNSFTYWENGELKKEGFTAGSDRYRAVWGDFLRELISHLEEKGWFDRAYIGIDERGFSAAAFDMIDSVTNSDGEPLKTAGAMDGFVNKKDLAMRVDDLNVGDNAAAAHAEEFADLLKARQEAGLRTTLYSCTEHKPGNFALSAPVESYWGMVNAAKMGTAGFLRWAYDAWVEDPLRDATHNAFEPGDCFLIYPDEKDAANPASKRSVRLERMAEGVRDVNKLMYLEKEMPALADEIQSLYNGITTTAGTARSYLSAAEKTALAEQMNAFKAGISRLTDNYTRFMAAEEPGLYLMGSEKEMKVGQKYTIQAKLVTDQADKTITYRSSDPSVAYVDASGAVTARSLGETRITLTAAGYTASVDVTVTEKTLIIKNTLTDYKLPEEYLSDVYKGNPDAGRPSEVKDNYLGQPDMIMLDDNQTLITVFPAGHGRGRIIMMKSRDAGETWEQQKVPDSWLDSFETPTIYKLNMTDGTTKLIVISGRPSNFGAPTGGWDTSISDDNGETWSEFETFQEGPFTDANNTVVAMASLVQLKDGDGNYIDKWMGVYHNGGSFINYKTYLTFDENGNQQWTDPVPYLSEYRNIESSHQICEVGMFRSPDEKRIVALARSQTHSHPATMFYSDDEGETWSKPVDLPGSLAGERHKAMYDPSDPTGQRMIVTFREIQYDKNNNNQFDGDWMAGDWIGWVGTYDQLMNLEDGMYRVLLCEDWAANAKSGDTGYTGIVAQPDGTFIMDSYGHWDKEYSESLNPYNVYNDWCWIKQAKFKLSVFDEQFAPVMAGQLQEEIDSAPADWTRFKYTEESFDRMKAARDAAKALLDGQDQTQAQYGEALRQLQKMKSRLTMKGVEKEESPVTGITVTPDRLVISKVGAAGKLNAAVAPANATDKEILWKSDRPDVVAVSNKGAVMALREGSAQITATAADGSGISKTAVVIVGDSIAVTGVTIAETNFELEVGKTKKLTANVAPANASDRRVSWESADETVATASPDGTVTARKEGTAKITVTTADGSKTAEVTVKVTPRSEESIEKDKAKQAWAAALEEADKIDMASGSSKYTAETWTPFKSAFDELKELTDAQIEAMTPDALKAKVKKLTDAQNALKLIESGPDEQETEQAKKQLEKKVEEVADIYGVGEQSYTSESWIAFKEAYEEAKSPAGNLSLEGLNALAARLEETKNALALSSEKTSEIAKVAEDTGKEILAGNKNNYKKDAWEKYTAAYNALKAANANEAGAAELIRLQIALAKAKEALTVDTGWVAAKKALNAALSAAKTIYDSKNANGKYTADSWKRFSDAYVAANRKAAATVMDSDAANLQALAKALKEAKLVEAPSLQAGDFIDKAGVRYTVVNATQKTVKAAGISSQKKKLTKINIPSTVEIKNMTCRVTEIDKNAFRKFTKLKTVKLGANVTKIGKQAFDGCTAMQELSMSATEKMAFDTKAFNNCKKLKKITFKTKKVPVFKKTVFTKLPANPKVTLGKMKAKDKKTMKAKLKKAGLKSNKIK